MLVALLGGILASIGTLGIVGRYRRAEVRLRYALAVPVGLLATVTYAVTEALRPDVVTGPLTIVLLLPAFVAIVVVVHEHRGGRAAGGANG